MPPASPPESTREPSQPSAPQPASAAGPAVSEAVPFLTLPAMIEHIQGHRRLTRRVIEVYPEEELFRFRIGGMRSFGELALELLRVTEPLLRGVATGRWEAPDWEGAGPDSKAALLKAWDEATEQIEAHGSRITEEALAAEHLAFGEYPGLGRDHLLYALDNEVHHRGQGYVYLRALEVEPPFFWER